MEHQQQPGQPAAHAPASNAPAPAPEWKRPRHRARNIVIAASCALCIIGVAALGFALTLPGDERAEEGYGISGTGGPDLTDISAAVPGELNVLVDTWGQEPPANGVSGTYAAALASDVAERYFGAKPAGRAHVVLSGEGWNFSPDHYDTAGEIAWNVDLQLEGGGSVEVMVGALNGVDAEASIYRDAGSDYEGSWLEEFDEWERTGVPPSERYAPPERDPSVIVAPTIEELSNEERARWIAGFEAKRAAQAEEMAKHAGDPRAEAAIAIVNETGLGDGAEAVSAEWASMGYSEDESDCSVDVTLDNGEHLFLLLEGYENCELVKYERHHCGWLDLNYGNNIAKLQALIDQSSGTA